VENPIRRSAAAIDESGLAAFEAEVGLTLPDDYRAFLLDHNGGVPRRTEFRHVGAKGQGRDTWLTWIYPLGREGLIDPSSEDLLDAYRSRPRGLPAGLLPVASAYFLGNTGFVCVACSGADAGKVFFRPNVEADKDTAYPVADSWSAFLAGLRYEEGRPKPWKEAIEDGDTARLRDWLEQNKKRWKNDRGFSLEIERAAVAENHWPTILTLIESGYDPESLFEESLGDNRFELAHRLLHTGKVGKRAVRKCLITGNVYLWHLPPLLEELLAAGADVNAQSDGGSTPLHRAVEARSEAGLRLLLEKGADPTIPNDDGRTPLALTRRLEEPRLGAILGEAEAVWKARQTDTGPEVVEFDFHGVTISKTGPRLTLEEIKAFEAEIGLAFPPEYRGLLLKANGGVPRPNRLTIPTDEEDDASEDDDFDPGEGPGEGDIPEFDAGMSLDDYKAMAAAHGLPIPPLPPGAGADEEGGPWGEYDVEPQGDPKVTFLPLRTTGIALDSVEDARGWYHDSIEIPRGMVPIGSLDGYGYVGPGFLLLGCRSEDRGKLFAMDYSARPLGLTLPELFERLAATRGQRKSPGERLAEAVEAGDLDGVRAALADGANPRAVGPNGGGPLWDACQAGFDDAVLAMAEAGTKPDHLLAPAVHAGRFALVRRLLAHGEGPSKRALEDAMMGNPALFADLDLVKEFAARGVDLKRKIVEVPIYLNLAAAGGSVEGLQFMLEAGRHDPHYRDDQGKTLLHHAAMATSGDPAAVIRHLLSLGVKPNQPTAAGHTALHDALWNGNADAARALIDAGEDLHARHEQYVPGRNREQSARDARQSFEMAQQWLGRLGSLAPDADGPPPPDTSHPLGEKIAELRAALDQRAQDVLGMLGEKLAARASGSWGQGPSAAELSARRPDLAPLLAELEAYAAEKKQPRA
jgi:cell wall assembly regulator SMI1